MAAGRQYSWKRSPLWRVSRALGSRSASSRAKDQTTSRSSAPTASPLLTYVEVVEQREAERQRADDEHQRADDEHQLRRGRTPTRRSPGRATARAGHRTGLTMTHRLDRPRPSCDASFSVLVLPLSSRAWPSEGPAELGEQKPVPRQGRSARRLCDRRRTGDVPRPGQRRIPAKPRHPDQRSGSRQVLGPRRRRNPAGDRRGRYLHDAP